MLKLKLLSNTAFASVFGPDGVGNTHVGDKVYVCAANADATLDETGFEALAWVEVGKMGRMGELGVVQNVATYTLWNGSTLKGKGTAAAGDPELEVARDETDAGQIILRSFAAVANSHCMAIRVDKQDGNKKYSRALVMGPSEPQGNADDFDLQVFTLGLVQYPLTPATP